jgi:hypothetical protein
MEFFPTNTFNYLNSAMKQGEARLKDLKQGKNRMTRMDGSAIPYSQQEKIVLERNEYREAKAKRLALANLEKHKKSLAAITISERHIEPSISKAEYESMAMYPKAARRDPRLKLPKPEPLPAPPGRTEQRRTDESIAREKAERQAKKIADARLLAAQLKALRKKQLKEMSAAELGAL